MVNFPKTDNEVILRKFKNAKGEKYILTGGSRKEYTSSYSSQYYKIRNLYKERHIAKDFDTFEKVASKEYDNLNSEKNIKWVTNDYNTAVNINTWKRPRALNRFSIVGKNTNIQLNVQKEGLKISKFELNEKLAQNLTPKIKRVFKLIQKNF